GGGGSEAEDQGRGRGRQGVGGGRQGVGQGGTRDRGPGVQRRGRGCPIARPVTRSAHRWITGRRTQTGGLCPPVRRYASTGWCWPPWGAAASLTAYPATWH